MRPQSWIKLPFLCVDTETTGVNPFEDRIVEVAAVDVWSADSDQPPSNLWSTIVNPGVPIPEGAAAVHGITDERAATEGVPTRDALLELAARIWAHHETWRGQAAIVMFNARFDWPLLICEAERHGVEWPVFAPILDPYLIDRMCDRFRPGKRQLTLVASHYGVQLAEDEAHGALADATAAGRVMRRICDQFPEITELSLASLWLRQVRGHEEDRERFVDWMRRNRDPLFDTPPGWPIPAGEAS